MPLTKPLAVAVILSVLVAAEAQASLTYQIAPRPGDKEGWSLDGGFITTDGTLGPITIENFESWEVRFTSPDGSRLIDSADGQAFSFAGSLSGQNPIGLRATIRSINIDTGRGLGGLYSLILSNQDIRQTDFTGQAFRFYSFGSNVLPGGFNQPATGSDAYSIQLIDGVIDSTQASPLLFSPISNHNQSSLLRGEGLSSLASIPAPEPNTALLATAALALLALRRSGGPRRLRTAC